MIRFSIKTDNPKHTNITELDANKQKRGVRSEMFRIDASHLLTVLKNYFLRLPPGFFTTFFTPFTSGAFRSVMLSLRTSSSITAGR